MTIRNWTVYVLIGLGLLLYWIGILTYAIAETPNPVTSIYGTSPVQVYKTPLESIKDTPCPK